MSDWENRLLMQPLLPDGLDIDDFNVVLVKFKNTHGQQRYIYLAVPIEIYARFLEERKTRPAFNYSEYGEILATGDGEPSVKLKMTMERFYNVINL